MARPDNVVVRGFLLPGLVSTEQFQLVKKRFGHPSYQWESIRRIGGGQVTKGRLAPSPQNFLS